MKQEYKEIIERNGYSISNIIKEGAKFIKFNHRGDEIRGRRVLTAKVSGDTITIYNNKKGIVHKIHCIRKEFILSEKDLYLLEQLQKNTGREGEIASTINALVFDSVSKICEEEMFKKENPEDNQGDSL